MKTSKSKLLPRNTVKIAGGEIMDSNFNELDLFKEWVYGYWTSENDFNSITIKKTPEMTLNKEWRLWGGR